MHASSSFAISRVPLLTLVAGIGLTIGFLVPVVYELTEKPWNRTRLVGLERAAMVTVVVACGLGVLEFWHVKRLGSRRKKASGTSLERVGWAAPTILEPVGTAHPTLTERRRRMQFGLWQLFVVMTLAAVVLAVVKWLGVSWASGLVAAVVLGVLAWGLFQEPRLQLRAAALVAGLFCPLVWMVAYNVPFGSTSGLVAAMPFAPAILPAALIGFFASRGPDEMGMVAGLIVVAELLLGAWLAWRGGKLFVAYLLLVLLVSSVSSFGIHALYRA